MLKTLLGHWKAHRRKPSLLPEEGDVHYEDPTTVNPLFEDSDSSISSTKGRADTNFVEKTEVVSQTEPEQNSEQKKKPEKLVDLEAPVDSSETIEHESENLNEVIVEQEQNESFQKSRHISESDNVKNDDISINTEHKDANQVSLASSSHDEASKNFQISGIENVSLETGENMRIYQPSTSAISNDHKIYAKTFGANTKGSPGLFTSTVADAENGGKVSNDIEKETKERTEILKHNANQLNPATEKNNSSTSKVHPSNELGKPENLRARAIDELIKKFQGRSSENDKTSMITQSVKKDISSNLEENNKIHNDVTKIERNDSSVISKPILKSEICTSDLQKESLSNIFKFPPPPPIENLKHESSLHGRILTKNIKSNNTDVPTSSKIEDNVNKLDETEQGTTRSDSSLERTRTASSNKSKENINKKEMDVKNESRITILEPVVRESFLHSPKNRAMCSIKKAGSEQNNKASKNHTKEITTQSKNLELKAENIVTNLLKTEKFEPQPHTSKDSVLSEAASVLENTKVNPPKTKSKESQRLISKKIASDKKDSQRGIFKEVSLSKQDSQHVTSREAASDKNNSLHMSSRDVALNKNNSQSVISENVDSDKEDSQPLTFKEVASDKSNSHSRPLPSTNVALDKKDSQPITSKDVSFDNKESFTLETKVRADTSFLNEDANQITNKHDSPKHKLKSSLSKASAKININKENENMISHSEDSGITRGDQISSEATQEASPNNPPEETSAIQNPRKPRKEKKLKSVNKTNCKKCRRNHYDSISLKRSRYDDYYDVLTGSQHSHRGKHSDSFTSELSWEEKELLRRLRSRKGTVRSNTPSTRSRLSKHKIIDENHFRRFHNTRRSSDESTLFGSSSCSCDECWAKYVRDYAYGRTSLRGMPPVNELCTCRNSRHNFLGRRVQFLSDTIPEATPSEKTTRTTSPISNADTNKQEDNTTEDKSSQKSSLKDSDCVSQNPNGSKQKKLKFSEGEYRIVTPWELEQWDYLVRKQLLQKRRKRARCMGLIALAIVVFVGLVVAILMVYLRRKTL